jgi:hypothetical protein
VKLSLKNRIADPKRTPAQDHKFTSVDRLHPKNRLARVSGYGETTGKARPQPSVYNNYPGMLHD